jgi:hypothetical protein
VVNGPTHYRGYSKTAPVTVVAWVAYQALTTPWGWQLYTQTCRGRKKWNVLIKIHYFLEHLLVFLQTVSFVEVDLILIDSELYSKKGCVSTFDLALCVPWERYNALQHVSMSCACLMYGPTIELKGFPCFDPSWRMNVAPTFRLCTLQTSGDACHCCLHKSDRKTRSLLHRWPHCV